jgi:hypothetical protein
MGLNTGPVGRFSDINETTNFSGSGIVKASRVMSFGGPGHILISNSMAEIVVEFEEFRDYVTDIGTLRDKHGSPLHVYNFHNGHVGRRWAGPAAAHDLRLAVDLESARSLPGTPIHATEAVGGAIPVESQTYVVRESDEAFRAARIAGHPTLLLHGIRQVGKTSLLARALNDAKNDGSMVAYTDFKAFSAAEMELPERFYFALAESLAGQLDPSYDVAANWSSLRVGGANVERLIRKTALADPNVRLLWALDDMDRLFDVPFGSEVFGLLRSWHNRHAVEPWAPLSRLTVAITYSTEPSQFITDSNRSPFNVGTLVNMRDFTKQEVVWLNGVVGGPIRTDGDIAATMELLNGHPYLVRKWLSCLLDDRYAFDDLVNKAGADDGPFIEHLRHVLKVVGDLPGGAAAVWETLSKGTCTNHGHFFRLRSAGILAGDSPDRVRIRCRLYESYLRRSLPPA